MNGRATGNDDINIVTLKTGEYIISNTLAKLSCTLNAYQKEENPQHGRTLKW